MDASKRRLCFGLPLALAALAAGGAAGAGAKSAKREKVVKIEARKFAYTPNVIPLKLGEPVTLELRAIDFTHGFNIPDLKQRADLMPGQVVRLRIVPDKAGDLSFLCDNFCGDGHEEMNGKFVVSA